MRTLLPGALLVSCVLFPSSAALAQAGGGSGATRSLVCSPEKGGKCDVSCVSPDKTVLFVYDRVESVAITEYGGRHTLLEVQRTNPSELLAVMVGDVSYCSFNGLRDGRGASAGRAP